jgi:hypothetical protein
VATQLAQVMPVIGRVNCFVSGIPILNSEAAHEA